MSRPDRASRRDHEPHPLTFHTGRSEPSGAFRFPDGFLWGTATSAYQVEGFNTNADWWEWEQQPGRITAGGRSGAACNWWHAAEADFDRMAALGQNAHRLSVEWSRIEPAPGRWDEAALARYRAMVSGLRARGITPMVTLHHFTFPLWVARRGGWLWSGLPQAMARFARRVVEALGDLVTLWCTLNEPVGAIVSGFLTGRFPPGGGGLRLARRALVQAVRTHAALYHTVHALQPAAQVGPTAYLRLFDPARPVPFDRAVAAVQDRLLNWAFLDALYTGRLPALLHLPPLPEARGTMDFVGVNYYTRDLVALDLRAPRRLFARNFHAPGALMSDGGYGEIYPEGLYRVLQRARAYGRPLYVTENGLPDADDDRRPAFILDHLRQLSRAVQAGCDVRGYFHWTLVDNFEWADGWTLRFGLIALDPATQARTPRPSAEVYAGICRTGVLPEQAP